MTTVKKDYQLSRFQRRAPVIWTAGPFDLPKNPDATNPVMESIFGESMAQGIRAWGHETAEQQAKNGTTGLSPVHYLATRAGYVMHHDIGWTRYTHQLIVRNDAFRLGGYDDQDDLPMLYRGSMVCLDTWSPHKVRPDLRFGDYDRRYKVMLVVDRDEPLTPQEAWDLLSPHVVDGPITFPGQNIPRTPPNRKDVDISVLPAWDPEHDEFLRDQAALFNPAVLA